MLPLPRDKPDYHVEGARARSTERVAKVSRHELDSGRGKQWGLTDACSPWARCAESLGGSHSPVRGKPRNLLWKSGNTLLRLPLQAITPRGRAS